MSSATPVVVNAGRELGAVFVLLFPESVWFPMLIISDLHLADGTLHAEKARNEIEKTDIHRWRTGFDEGSRILGNCRLEYRSAAWRSNSRIWR